MYFRMSLLFRTVHPVLWLNSSVESLPPRKGCVNPSIIILPLAVPNPTQRLQDHLTLLNAYNAFTRYGQTSSWCRSHALSFRAMSRAVSIRSQLKKYMVRFGLPMESCEGDQKRLRRCLVSGYWRNGARWVNDGTFRSVRGDKVSHTRSSISNCWGVPIRVAIFSTSLRPFRGVFSVNE